jgi:hypothetical protein
MRVHLGPAIHYRSKPYWRTAPGQLIGHPGVGRPQGECTIVHVLYTYFMDPPMKYDPEEVPSDWSALDEDSAPWTRDRSRRASYWE